MISIDALRDDREEAYKVWFERWWARADIEREIINANARGFTSITIKIDEDKYTKNRLRDDLFLKFLGKKLLGFKFSSIYTQGLINTYKTAVKISWDISDESEE